MPCLVKITTEEIIGKILLKVFCKAKTFLVSLELGFEDWTWQSSQMGFRLHPLLKVYVSRRTTNGYIHIDFLLRNSKITQQTITKKI